MIRINLLKAKIVENGYSASEVARKIGISPQAFYRKMKQGVFGSDEISAMIDVLRIENPIEIFFAKDVTDNVTKES